MQNEAFLAFILALIANRAIHHEPYQHSGQAIDITAFEVITNVLLLLTYLGYRAYCMPLLREAELAKIDHAHVEKVIKSMQDHDVLNKDDPAKLREWTMAYRAKLTADRSAQKGVEEH